MVGLGLSILTKISQVQFVSPVGHGLRTKEVLDAIQSEEVDRHPVELGSYLRMDDSIDRAGVSGLAVSIGPNQLDELFSTFLRIP